MEIVKKTKTKLSHIQKKYLHAFPSHWLYWCPVMVTILYLGTQGSHGSEPSDCFAALQVCFWFFLGLSAPTRGSGLSLSHQLLCFWLSGWTSLYCCLKSLRRVKEQGRDTGASSSSTEMRLWRAEPGRWKSAIAVGTSKTCWQTSLVRLVSFVALVTPSRKKGLARAQDFIFPTRGFAVIWQWVFPATFQDRSFLSKATAYSSNIDLIMGCKKSKEF